MTIWHFSSIQFQWKNLVFLTIYSSHKQLVYFMHSCLLYSNYFLFIIKNIDLVPNVIDFAGNSWLFRIKGFFWRFELTGSSTIFICYVVYRLSVSTYISTMEFWGRKSNILSSSYVQFGLVEIIQAAENPWNLSYDYHIFLIHQKFEELNFWQ